MLKVDHLLVRIGEKEIVQDVSFQVEEGSITAIVGESGSGKTMTALSIMGLLPPVARAEGSILLDGQEILGICRNDYSVSMIFQEPMTSLNPLMKVGKQVEEFLKLHTALDKKARKEKVVEMLQRVELSGAQELYDKFPHELSGGMRQRVMIAMAMIHRPKVLIADEPTTALDAVRQRQIIELLRKLNREEKTAMIFISHDLSMVQDLADQIIVMKDGKVVEAGTSEDIFQAPKQEYTRQLIQAIPKGKKQVTAQRDQVLVQIEDVSLYYKERHKKNIIAGPIGFQIHKGEIVGLVGKSGCGKTSLCKAIVGLNPYYTGIIDNHASGSTMVFQDPLNSLNPVRTVKWILEEPLRVQKKYGRQERREKVLEMLCYVGLTEEYMTRYPSELSGGQRQRVGIAAALIGGAEFVVADEAVSALDVTVQAQILDLLLQLQKQLGLTILFISHDLRVVEKICDRIVEI